MIRRFGEGEGEGSTDKDGGVHEGTVRAKT